MHIIVKAKWNGRCGILNLFPAVGIVSVRLDGQSVVMRLSGVRLRERNKLRLVKHIWLLLMRSDLRRRRRGRRSSDSEFFHLRDSVGEGAGLGKTGFGWG